MKWVMLFLALSPSSALADHELKNHDVALGQSLYADQCASCHGVISDDDIRDIIAFIRSTWSQRAQDAQDSRNLPHE